MKGVIATICPEARVVDLCHEIRSFQVVQGAFIVAQSYRYFPSGTVHIVVVDPGVGSARRPIAAEAAGQYFVAPDNGVLSQVYEREEHVVRTIEAERYALEPISRTFHGRDIFSPVGASLAKGAPFNEIGAVVDDYVRLEPATPVAVGPGHWKGWVLNIDRFGNIVTSFPSRFLTEAAAGFRTIVGRVEVRDHAESYAAGPRGRAFVVEGSSGYLELSLQQASAAEAAQVEIGDPVEWFVPG